MGRTACTEPQCLYKSLLYIYLSVMKLGMVVCMLECVLMTKYNLSLPMTRHINPLNPELYPICYLLALFGAHHFLHFSRIRIKLLTFRLLMSYIYGAPILDVSR